MSSLTTRITCIHTYTQTIHTHITYLQTNTYIHPYIHVHTDTPPPPTGRGRGILYIHTYILTYKYIHAPIHACTYRHASPTHRGGGGKTTCNRLAPPVHTDPCAPIPFGGGGGGACRPGPYIYITKYNKNKLSCQTIRVLGTGASCRVVQAMMCVDLKLSLEVKHKLTGKEYAVKVGQGSRALRGGL